MNLFQHDDAPGVQSQIHESMVGVNELKLELNPTEHLWDDSSPNISGLISLKFL